MSTKTIKMLTWCSREHQEKHRHTHHKTSRCQGAHQASKRAPRTAQPHHRPFTVLYRLYIPLGGWMVVAGLIGVWMGVLRGILRNMHYYRAGGNVVMRGVS
jgi:hypothetical protein